MAFLLDCWRRGLGAALQVATRKGRTLQSKNVMFSQGSSFLEPRSTSVDGATVSASEVYMCPETALLNGVLSTDECKRFISFLESSNRFCPAGGVAARNDLITWIAPQDVMNELWHRVAPIAMQVLRISRERQRVSAPVGLNGVLRCYRNSPGQAYLPHYDQARPRAVLGDDGNSYTWNHKYQSRHSLLIYLNSSADGAYVGGSTTLMPEGLQGLKIKMSPPSGGALLFPHGKHRSSILHAGEEVRSGVKYVVRSDVLFPV